MDRYAAFTVEISGMEGWNGTPAGHVLLRMSNEVQRIVLATEAEARHLGFEFT